MKDPSTQVEVGVGAIAGTQLGVGFGSYSTYEVLGSIGVMLEYGLGCGLSHGTSIDAAFGSSGTIQHGPSPCCATGDGAGRAMAEAAKPRRHADAKSMMMKA